MSDQMQGPFPSLLWLPGNFEHMQNSRSYSEKENKPDVVAHVPVITALKREWEVTGSPQMSG